MISTLSPRESRLASARPGEAVSAAHLRGTLLRALRRQKRKRDLEKAGPIVLASRSI